MDNMKNQKSDEMEMKDTELKEVSGGIVYNGEKLVCPTCGEEKLHGTEMLDANSKWVVRWYCPKCKESVFYTPLKGAKS